MGDVQGANYPRRKLSGCNYLGAIFLGENCPGGNCLGGVVRGVNCLGAVVLGGNCPGENARGAIVLGGSCPGGIVLFPVAIRNILREVLYPIRLIKPSKVVTWADPAILPDLSGATINGF